MSEFNSEEFEASDGGFEEGIAPETTEHVNFEVRSKFFPWHKPRKQWIRKNQWANSIGILIDKIESFAQGRSLRYLSLPGPDLLDVRSIQPVCEAKGVPLQFLGLNGGDDDHKEMGLEAALLNRVRSLPFIDPASEIVKDRLEQLAVKKSVAYSRVISAQKSFDVVNIDLCGSFAETPPGERGANIANAIFALLHHQATHRQEDWLFFITTRSNKDMVDPATMMALVNAINAIFERRPELRQGILDSNVLSEDAFSDGLLDIEKLSTAAYSNSFTLGLCHWVIQSLLDAERAWKADMLPGFEYHVLLEDPSCDMLSLGFHCSRIKVPHPDAFGLARLDDHIIEPEIEAIRFRSQQKINRRISEKKDVDLILYREPEVYREVLDISAALLGSCSYDEKKYREWAQQEAEKLTEFIETAGLA